MKVIGLTGSIGMGKSTAAALLRRLGVPVHEADAAVHKLIGRGGAAVPAVAAAFPGVVEDGAVDRRLLGARVFGDDKAMARTRSDPASARSGRECALPEASSPNSVHE